MANHPLLYILQSKVKNIYTFFILDGFVAIIVKGSLMS